MYGAKRYGTVHSPMTEWHGSSPASFPLFFSHLRTSCTWDERRRECACILVRTLTRESTRDERPQVPYTPAATYLAVRNRHFQPGRRRSNDIFINSRRFDDETLSLSLPGDDGSPLNDDGDRGWIMRIPSDVKCPHILLLVKEKEGSIWNIFPECNLNPRNFKRWTKDWIRDGKAIHMPPLRRSIFQDTVECIYAGLRTRGSILNKNTMIYSARCTSV